MRVIQNCLLVVVLASTCHGLSLFRNITHARALSSIRDNFVQDVRTAADELQQAAVHRTRATTGAISALGTLNADLIRNFVSNNINLWRFIASGIMSRELALRRMVFGNPADSRLASVSLDDFPQLRNMRLYPVLGDQPTILHINTILPENNEGRDSHGDDRIITDNALPEGDLETDTAQKAT